MEKHLISVIVPVYNVEKYLDKCIQSLINQTYENIEILLINDGSKDSSLEICEAWKNEDNRIKVFDKNNGGLSDARNYGISHSIGSYLYFVDSDDWVPIYAIEKLYKLILEKDADIVCGRIQEVFKRNVVENTACAKFLVEEFDTINGLEKLMYMHGVTNSASAKLYKKELFDGITYPYRKIYEDLGTTYKLFGRSKKIILTDIIVYYYYKENPHSIVNSNYSRNELDRINFSIEELDYINKEYPRIKDAAVFKLFYEALLTITKIPFNHTDMKYVYDIVKKYRNEVIVNRELNKKQKLFCMSSIFGPVGIKTAFKIRNTLYKINMMYK